MTLTEQKRQDLAQQLWTRESPLMQSHLIDELMTLEEIGSAFSWDEVENLYPDPSKWSVQECMGWIQEHTDIDTDEPMGGREGILEAIGDNADPAEPLEWWAVSEWFANKLREHGECILDNDYGTWWGRTTSGQSVVLDGVIQRIAVEALT